MLSILKRTQKKDIPHTEAGPAEVAQLASDKPSAETDLFIHTEWDLSIQERYVYQFHHAKLPKLLPNQLSITKIDAITDEDSFTVNAFIRNTLEKIIHLEEISLVLLNQEGSLLARKSFDLELEVPAHSCMPWIFHFSDEDFLAPHIPADDDWSIAFELKEKKASRHELMLHESWEKTLNDIQKTRLKDIVNNLPPLKSGEINFMGIQAQLTNKNDLSITLLIRNGSDKEVTLSQLPLFVEDASGELAAKGAFQLEDFIVRANTSKPWTFIFPEELLINKNPDLSHWKVYPKEKA